MSIPTPSNTHTQRYNIIEKIHESPNSIVSIGEIEGIGGFRKSVILKQFLGLSTVERQSLVRYATITGLLNHANIVQILDVHEWDNKWALVMEHVSGITLEELLLSLEKNALRIPENVVLYIIHEIISGIIHAHSFKPNNVVTSVLHRNLTPSNIMINLQGTVKIKGFRENCVLENTSKFYCPDTPCDQRTDIWGIGSILHTMIVGFHEADPLATQTSVPKNALERITQQAIHPNPAKRFQSVEAMKEILLHQCDFRSIKAQEHLCELLQKIPGMDQFQTYEQTFVSKTISKQDLLKMTAPSIPQPVLPHAKSVSESHNNISQQSSSSSPSLSALSTPTPPEKSSDTIPLDQRTQHYPSTKSSMHLGQILLGVTIGFLCGLLVYFLLPQYTQASDAKVILYFPEGTSIHIGDQVFTQSGVEHFVPAQTDIHAQWKISENNVKELQFHLQPGEFRWFVLEKLHE